MGAEWNMKNLYSGELIEILEGTEYKAGRSSSFEIVCLSKNVSRFHAKFTAEAGDFYVEDMNSANGTYINSSRISCNKQCLIRNGDIVSLGISDFRSYLNLEDTEPPYIFEVIQTIPANVFGTLQLGDEKGVEDQVEVDVIEPEITEHAIKLENYSDDTSASKLPITSNEKLLNSQLLNYTYIECPQNIKLEIESEKIDSLDTSRPAGYSIEDDIIVIDDESDCDFSSSQLFTSTHSDCTDSDKYKKIKIELEELDRENDDKLIVIDDSDSDNDWLFSNADIVAEINKLQQEFKSTADSTCNANEEQLIPNVAHNDNRDISPRNEQSPLLRTVSENSESKYLKPPIIEPLQEKLCKSYTRKKSSSTETKVIVTNETASDNCKQKGSIKRKTTIDEFSKRKKQRPNNKNDREIRFTLQKTENKRSTNFTDKHAREKIKQIRKKKLKELETKITNTKENPVHIGNAIQTSGCKKDGGASDRLKKANIKVSKGRGNFLLNIDDTANLGMISNKKLNPKSDHIKDPVPGPSKQIKPSHLSNTIKERRDNITKNQTSVNCNKNPHCLRVSTRELPMKTAKCENTNESALSSNNHPRNSPSSALKLSDEMVGNGSTQDNPAVKCNENVLKLSALELPYETDTNKNTGNKISASCNKNPKDPRSTRLPDETKTESILTSTKSREVHQNVGQYNVHNNNDTNSHVIQSWDVILNVINWKAAWLEQQKQLSTVPPVNNRTPVKMCHSFSCHDDYCNIVNPLLTLELWNAIYKSWLNVADESRQLRRKFWSSIDSVSHKSNYIVFRSTSYITKEQKNNRTHVRENDVILVNVPLSVGNQLFVKKIFGFVVHCTRNSLRTNDYVDKRLAQLLSTKPDSSLTLDIMIRCIPEKINLKRPLEGGIIMSMVSCLREFEAVKALVSSPLCKYILDPKIDDYLVPHLQNEKVISKDNLCETQQRVVLEAVSMCLRDKPGIYLIQGPPGTGKTTVIINILQNIIFNDNAKDIRILLVAPSNAAVDGIILKINKQVKPFLTEVQRKKIKLLRIGPKHAVHKEVEPYFLDERIKAYVQKFFFSQFPEVKKDYCKICEDEVLLTSEINKQKELGHNTREQEKRLAELIHTQKNFAKIYLKRNYFKYFEVAQKIVLGGANIICTTLSSCVRVKEQNLPLGKITCCIVDEATQSNEPETLLPLTLGIQKLILVGDPQQLPAVTVSQFAKELGHGQSLFARIKHHFENQPSNPIRMLNIQYRMHPEISLFPSNNFYKGELFNSPTYFQREDLNKLVAYYVFNLNSEARTNENYSNVDEVDCVFKLLNAISDTVGNNSGYSVGIITPYNTQKDALNRKLLTHGINAGVSISVNTVDSFQGLEKDVIILSCVRCSPNSFLSNEQRLNVAITRAKHVLYIIGTYSLFQRCATLNRIKRDAKERNLYVNINCSVSSAVLQAVISSK